jgi:hypothetical protein
MEKALQQVELLDEPERTNHLEALRKTSGNV